LELGARFTSSVAPRDRGRISVYVELAGGLNVIERFTNRVTDNRTVHPLAVARSRYCWPTFRT